MLQYIVTKLFILCYLIAYEFQESRVCVLTFQYYWCIFILGITLHELRDKHLLLYLFYFSYFPWFYIICITIITRQQIISSHTHVLHNHSIIVCIQCAQLFAVIYNAREDLILEIIWLYKCGMRKQQNESQLQIEILLYFI